ncbi:hypothetical protein JCM10908_003408 [Rhodotorula pacifica]|uniref:YqaE/Pmp3 family membrane protein n=1 Tax=Rhodotorula pacifica TaxID=1495444 RepID=UPI00317E655F
MSRPRETSSSSDILLYVIAIFIPPLALAMRLSSPEISGCDIVINILLWILGFIPGVLHAWWKLGKAERTRNRTVVYTQAPGPAGVRY